MILKRFSLVSAPFAMRLIAGLLILLWGLTAAADEVRTWTKAQGETVRAQFLREVDGDAVFLQDGKPLTIPFDELSEKDQKLIRELEKGKKVEETPVPRGAPTAAPAAPTSDEPEKKSDRINDRRPSLGPPRIVTETRSWREINGKVTEK